MTSLNIPSNWPLPTINVFIEQQENFLRGSLTSFRRDSTETILEIDDETGERPDKNTIITTGIPPNGTVIIGSSKIYIENQLVSAIAYRSE